MKYPSKIVKISGSEITLNTFEQINTERLKTLYGNPFNAEPLLVFEDRRKVTSKQRALYFALIGNIKRWSGHEIEELDRLFKIKYLNRTRKLISLANDTTDSVSDANVLLEILIDFMFQNNVPFERGYNLLPKQEQWYLYNCCKHRKCAICGKPSDIHHEEGLVGMGGNRKKHKHVDSKYISLCRGHHVIRHTMTWEEFETLYKVQPIKLDEETLKKINVM